MDFSCLKKTNVKEKDDELHITVKSKENIINDLYTQKEKIKDHCNAYEKKIADHGGIDLQILGIGNNGHIGFNEPGSSFYSKTRAVHLDQQTRIANTYEFQDLNKVPKQAITVGISSIMKAKK